MKLLKPHTLILILALTTFALATETAFAGQGTVAVNLGGVPKLAKGAERTVSVRAVQLSTGLITQSVAAKSTNLKLKLDPGPYLIDARLIDFPGTVVEGTSGLIAVKSGKTSKRRLKATPVGKKKRAKKKARSSAKKRKKHPLSSYFAPAAESAGKFIVGIDPAIKVKGLDGYPKGLEIDGVLATPLSRGCPGGEPDFKLVEIRRRAELMQEIDYGDDPMFDKTKVVKRGRWLKERQMVRGSGVIANGVATVHLEFVNIATGEVITASAAQGSDFIDVIDAAANQLLDNICSSRVDVTFTGHGTYKRDEGTSAGDSEDHVTANYSWSITYKNVSLYSAEAGLSFAATSQVDGTWTTDGRYGTAGPGSYHCTAPVIGYSGEFSLAKVEKFGENVRLNLAPYFQAQGDVLHTNCSGLSSPPYASFATWGSAAANQAVVDFAAADVSAGPLTFNVAPTSVLPPGCSDLLGSFEAPCSQSSTWSGQVTVARAGV